MDAFLQSATTFTPQITVSESVDLLPMPLLAALNVIFDPSSFVEPYLLASLTRDVSVTRTAAGTDITESSGVRHRGTPTSVVAFDLEMRFVRSTSPGDEWQNEWRDVPGGVHVRVPRRYAERLLDLPRVPGDGHEGGAELRVRADQFGQSGFVPSIMQISDVRVVGPGGESAYPDLITPALDLLRDHHPGIVAMSDGRAVRGDGALSSRMGSRQAAENQATLVRLLRPRRLPNITRQALTAEGFSFRLAATHGFARAEREVVVRVRALPVRRPDFLTGGRRMPASQLEMFRGYNDDMKRTVSRGRSLVLGADPIIVSLGGLGRGALLATEFAPNGRARFRRSDTLTSGFETNARHGVSVDDVTEFTADVEFVVSIESSATTQAAPAMPGAYPMTDLAPARPAPRALPVARSAAPVKATYSLRVPTVLTEEQLVAGDETSWRLYTTARLIQEGRVPRETLDLINADGGPVVYRPSEGDLLPANVVMMMDPSGLWPTVLGALGEIGADDVSAEARVEIAALLDVEGGQAHGWRRPRTIWAGVTENGSEVSVNLEFVPDRLTTIGVAGGFGTFSSSSLISVLGRGRQVATGVFAAWRQRFPLDLLSRDRFLDRTEALTFSPQPQIGYGREWTETRDRESRGTILRGQRSIDRTLLAKAEGHYKVTAEKGDGSPPSRTRRLQVAGLAAVNELTAHKLGLMPHVFPNPLDTSVSFRAPSVLREHRGLGGPVETPPDFGPFIEKVHEDLRARFGDVVADTVLDDLDKLGDPYTADAVLPALFDKFESMVTGRLNDSWSPAGRTQFTVTVEIKARPTRIESKGLLRTRQYLDHLAAVEDLTRESVTRNGRWQVEPSRAIGIWEPSGDAENARVNSAWTMFNMVWSGETRRDRSLAVANEQGTGIRVDAPEHRGAAIFDVDLELSAHVTVRYAPAALIDAVTLGVLRRESTLDIGPFALDEPVAVKIDPQQLDMAPAPAAHALGVPASARDPHAELMGRINEVRPPRPRIQLFADNRSLTERIEHRYAIDPDLFAGADIAVEPIADLDALRGHAYRVALPSNEFGDVHLGWVRSRLPGPGPAWFSESWQTSFISTALTDAQLAPRIVDAVTKGISVPILLPGWWGGQEATLDLAADVRGIRAGKTVDSVMRLTTGAQTTTVGAGTAVTRGWTVSPGVYVDFPLPTYANFQPDRANAAGFQVSYDRTHGTRQNAAVQSRTTARTTPKTSGWSYMQIALDVRWSVGVTFGEAAGDGMRRGRYVTTPGTREIVLWLPAPVAVQLLEKISPAYAWRALTDWRESEWYFHNRAGVLSSERVAQELAEVSVYDPGHDRARVLAALLHRGFRGAETGYGFLRATEARPDRLQAVIDRMRAAGDSVDAELVEALEGLLRAVAPAPAVVAPALAAPVVAVPSPVPSPEVPEIVARILARATRIANTDDADQVTVGLLKEFHPTGIRTDPTPHEEVFEPVDRWYDRVRRNGEAVRSHTGWEGIIGDLSWGSPGLAVALPDSVHPLPSLLVLDGERNLWQVGWQAGEPAPHADRVRTSLEPPVGRIMVFNPCHDALPQ
jgi:hypothetical protein